LLAKVLFNTYIIGSKIEISTWGRPGFDVGGKTWGACRGRSWAS